MSKYYIANGTEGLLITQESNVNVKTEPWTMRKNKTYEQDSVMIDPDNYELIAGVASESLAARLSGEGYIVFSDTSNRDSKYMIAIQKHKITIS